MAASFKCSFCDKEQDTVGRLIASPSNKTHICDECVLACCSILSDDGMELVLPPQPSFRMRLAKKIAGDHSIRVMPKTST